MSARDELRAIQGGRAAGSNGSDPAARPDTSSVMFDAKGKLLLPELPDPADSAGLCRWLTTVFNLDSRHPITSAVHEGLRGPEGHVVLRRAGDVPPIRIEPATRANNPMRLTETLAWRCTETDGLIHAFKADHCREISYVIRVLCGASKAMSDEQEAEAIVSEFIHGGARPAEGHTTHGTSAQRYEAAVALRREIDEITGRPTGPPRYVIDAGYINPQTGEIVGQDDLVIAVSDLQDAARRHVGSSLPRGWLDARIESLGWTRITLQGYGQPGRAGRQGPHARITAYRGQLPVYANEDQQDTPEGVNT